MQRRRFLFLLLLSPLPLSACSAVAQASVRNSGGVEQATPKGPPTISSPTPAVRPRVTAATAASMPSLVTSASTLTASALPASTSSPIPTATERPNVRLAAVHDGDLAVLDTATGSLTQLTNDGINATPRWTTDGQTLFFAKQPFGKQGETWRWQPGSDPVQVQAGLWSPDGSAVAYMQPAPDAVSGTSTVWVERAGTRHQITPTERGREWEALAWSPDSRRLALARYTTMAGGPGGVLRDLATLWLTDPTLTQRSQLPLPNPHGQMHSWPDTVRWSPDGSWLLLGVGPGQGCSSCRADGLPFYALPATGGGAAVLLERALSDGAIAWAPDGRWTVFSGGANVGRSTYQKKRLTRFDGLSGQYTILTSDPQWSDIAPAVSPDSRQIAFARGHSQRPGETTIAAITSRQVWVMAATGGQQRPVTNTAGWTDEAPVWTPDGAWIVFVRWRPKGAADPAAAGLWAVRPDGSQLQPLGVTIGSSHGPTTYINGFGYYGSFGWDHQYAIAPKP